jgi:large subunit ribosomal protein L3
MKALITRKIGMTSLITEDGSVVAVTLLSASPNVVTQVKTIGTDGYTAIQLGFGVGKNISKPVAGHLKAAKATSSEIREFRTDGSEDAPEVGSEIDATSFVGDIIDATGESKGKGFAGAIKRHNFHRGRKTHGGRSYRRVGSIGSMYPQKVFKGKRMPGHMGDAQVTVQNLKVMTIDPVNQLIAVAGAVPGPKKGLVYIKEAK